MTLRRTRVPFQGLSNRNSHQSMTLFGANSDLLSTNVQLKNPSSPELFFINKSELLKSKGQPFLQCEYRAKFKARYFNLQQQNAHKKIADYNNGIKRLKKSRKSLVQKWQSKENFLKNQKSNQILHKLRQVFKTKTNLRKITRAWGFQNKMYIQEQSFRNIMNNNLGLTINQSDCHDLIRSVSQNHKKLDVDAFINLLYKTNVSMDMTKPNLNITNPKNQSDNQNQVDNLSLNTKIKALTLNAKLEANKPGKALKQQIDKNLDLVNLKKLKYKNAVLQSSKTLPIERSMFSTINTSTKPCLQYLKGQFRSRQFNPSLFYEKNQKKTRYGATTVEVPKDQSLPQNRRQNIACSKQKVVEALNEEKKIMKLKYERKLDKIRQMRNKQKENIISLDRAQQNRDLANMKKTRQENIAYNYVNFLKNEWK